MTNLLTDGSWMDEGKNSEPHRIDEVKNTCFKSKWQKYPWILVDLGAEVSVITCLIQVRSVKNKFKPNNDASE